MASITSTGIGSGLDVTGLVQSLVAAEGQPARQRLVQQETRFQGKLSAYGSLRSALAEFQSSVEKLQDAKTLQTRRVTLENEDAFSVEADEDAVPVSYQVEVVSLAEAERLTSSVFAGPDAAVGTGTLTVSVAGAAFDVTIDAENNTLEGIRDAINAAADNSGVQATIVNADAGSYLILKGDETGAANVITVTQAGGDGGLAAIAYDPGNGIANLTRSVAAADGQIRVDGFDVFSDSNVYEGVIDGATITTIEPTSGQAYSLDIAYDNDDVRKTIGSFVTSYNALTEAMDNLSRFDAESGDAGPLQGDAALRSVSILLRRELGTASTDVDKAFDTLSEIGIAIDENGKLEIDSEKLDAVIESDFRQVGALFSADGGYANRLGTLLDSFLDPDGLLQTRTDGLQSSIDRITEQGEALDERLVRLEARLLRQFNGLDSLISQLTTSGNFLSQQLANLPTPSANRNR